MNTYLTSVLIAFVSGLFAAIQGAINSHIGKTSGQYAMIIGVSLTQALICALLLLRSGWGAFAEISSPWMLIAGLLGAAIMFGVSFSIGSIGTLSVFVLLILGQIIASSVIDSLGWFGAPKLPLTPQKIGSLAVIMLGVYWLIKSS